MSLAKATRTVSISRLEGAGAAEAREDSLAAEEPLEIRVSGHSVAVVITADEHGQPKPLNPFNRKSLRVKVDGAFTLRTRVTGG